MGDVTIRAAVDENLINPRLRQLTISVERTFVRALIGTRGVMGIVVIIVVELQEPLFRHENQRQSG